MQVKDDLVGDPGGGAGPGSPLPIKTSQKRDGHRAEPQVSQVMGPLEQISRSATDGVSVCQRVSKLYYISIMLLRYVYTAM